MKFRYYFYFLVIFILILFYSFLKEDFIINSFIKYESYFSNLIELNFYFYIFLSFILFTLWIALLLPFISIFQIIIGYTIGVKIGFLVNYSAIIIGSYLTLVFLNTNFVYKILGEKISSVKLPNFFKKFFKNKFILFFFMRLIPGVPFMIQNFLAYILKINHFTFIKATALGIWPICLLNSYFGSILKDIYLYKTFSFASVNINTYIFLIIYAILVLYKSMK